MINTGTAAYVSVACALYKKIISNYSNSLYKTISSSCIPIAYCPY